MKEKPLKLWAVVIGTRGRDKRYISGYPQPRAFFTKAGAQAHKYNEGNSKDMHVVKLTEQVSQ